MILRLFVMLLLIYIWFAIFLYLSQKSMLYFPENKDFYDCNLFDKNEQKEYKQTRFYEKKWEKEGVIVFFHWNAWSACSRSYIKWLLEKTWYSIIFLEYSGYSDINNSKPNIKDILKDVENLWKYIESKNYKNVYVLWRSLWGGPASYYSSKFKTSKLILISSYSQLYKVAADMYPVFPIKYLFSENYNSEEYLKNYDGDILIVHWKLDKVIPFKHGKELYDSIKSKNKIFLEIPNATHHNIFAFDEVNTKILEFLK